MIERETLYNLTQENLSTHKIAKMLDCGQTTVRYYLEKYDIKTNFLGHKHNRVCPVCQILLSIKQKTFCSQYCQQSHSMLEKINSGKASSRTCKNYLIRLYGPKCSKCGWDKKNVVTNKCPIEINHIDGNSDNNSIINLELLCPNCHSLTANYKALNVGKGRHSRRIRYQLGKSY